ncbi:YbaB/EbfC family nucleoid-associated protein [Micromonospora sp. WMMD1102]|uniref:YbaB/EbfC family nucleoid-associated protein n=1 Tax=Micromonospora sp. WMMD1102 TaxID=3016105 RepID=UPI0024159537|nr:YbaB/EbfC family nucleoid-associated protein [Micromonospora sp. WMMD1102]MDG4789886.1 YbaB/EbfC family nucleoid-associated protein [Micromonospora sp. WMMD1102]
MSAERRIHHLGREIELVSWQLDGSNITGSGADESGLVQVSLDGTGQVREVKIGRDWWRDLGPERLQAAIVEALDRAVGDRLAAWSVQVAEREADEPPAGWQPPVRQRSEGDSPDRRDPDQPAGGDDRDSEVARVVDLLRDAMSELDGYRERVDDQAGRQVLGSGEGGRVTVAMTAGRVTQLEISQRWLREQPTGQSVAEEVEAACQDAYQRASQQAASLSAASPAISQVRELAAHPMALLRRLGLG